LVRILRHNPQITNRLKLEKMKTLTAFLVTTFCVCMNGISTAQNDCNTTLSLFAENVKMKRFTEATPQLAFLRQNCPTLNYAIYALGEKVIGHQLKQTKTKQPMALELIQLYKDRIELFPEKTEKGTFLPKIGETMLNYHIGTLKEQYDLFDEAFKTDPVNFTNPKQLYWYFELYYKIYVSKKHEISLEDLLEKYETIHKKFKYEREQLYKTTKDAENKNIVAIDIFLKKITMLVEKEATCETLLPMYKKKFEAYKNNAEWMRSVARKLDAKDCKEDALFIKLIEAIDVAEPTAESKFLLYEMHSQKGNTAKAKTYLDQYFKLETDILKKGNMLNNLGIEAAKKGNKSTARTYYLEAIEINPSSGKSYLNLAKLYGSSANECGTKEFTKRAIYWKATEMARKAAQVDASIKKEANELIPYYMERAPSKKETFNEGYKGGEKIEMKCWVGGYVIVPKL